MKNRLRWGVAFAILLMMSGGTSIQAKEIPLNTGFEVADAWYWAQLGNIPSVDRGVKLYDVNGDTNQSWCYWDIPWDNNWAGLSQSISVIQGVTYTVSADICYHNC